MDAHVSRATIEIEMNHIKKTISSLENIISQLKASKNKASNRLEGDEFSKGFSEVNATCKKVQLTLNSLNYLLKDLNKVLKILDDYDKCKY